MQQGEHTDTKGQSGSMRVLLANEPLAYREVLYGAIQKLRPYIEVRTAEPANLDEEFLRYTPGFVVCSRSTPLIEREAPAWVELYPGHTSGAVASLTGTKTTFEAMDFDVLLSILDEAQRLYQSV